MTKWHKSTRSYCSLLLFNLMNLEALKVVTLLAKREVLKRNLL
jgi:hypothetical protein